ncbi:MAG: sodium ion-translocating decarboxylase subunit beta [Clostridiales Family XIII bacterium]|jgi:oxaloacetate decarboxylase beta subunit|nr:sodium ion-translocating decarboxylase subunit beta [Clostridiales Family XIII bacterium]
MSFAFLFQGIGTLFYQAPAVAIARVVLIVLGILLVYLGKKGTLEPLIMIPMGFGMSAVNAGVLFLDSAKAGAETARMGTLFMDPLVTDVEELVNIIQIDFLQPIFTFTFSNGLVACLVFMGVGVITDVGNVLRFPFTSMLIAMCAELGTIVTYPIARAMDFTAGEAAAAAVVGTADGPMVLFTSLILAKPLFVPITIIAYLYLSLCYGGYPFLIRLLIPKELRGIVVKSTKKIDIGSKEKIIFDVVACTLLCLLFPMAAPLFVSFFLGNAIKESGVVKYVQLLEDVFLYAATFFLGLLLGVLCEASTLLNPLILKLLILGMLALALAGVGGIIGGYLVYLINGKKFNPTIGIAGVSCVPTTAKVAQKAVYAINKRVIILQYALGACVCGVITSAILTGLYVSAVPML